MSVLPTVERLKLQAARASDIERQMAEAKSLRQESNTEQRTDLYMWPTPEQTTEGKAAALIAELYEALDQLLAITDDPFNDAAEEESVFPFARRVLAKARGES